MSVVVPTYATPEEGLQRLVNSLLGQTMPAQDFEVVFVDDGSPDQTWQRLVEIERHHSNIRIHRIENSGWPSRPRNVGVGLARGEYVLFMDHDDELYPRALEAGHAMAVRTGADVLNGKETRTDQSKWALEVYERNLDNAVGRTDLHPLIPTNPHKLFRRAMLVEHGIRFPEGGRVPWEDVFFALDVAPHARVISVLADVPFYHWVRGSRTTSSSFGDDLREHWHWVREILVRTNISLAGPEMAQQWRLMMLHQYRSRVLAPMAAMFRVAPDVFDQVRRVVDEVFAEHLPVELDAYLTPTQLGRASLARAGRWDLLGQLVKVDAGLLGTGRTTSVVWRDGVLEVATESRWQTTSGKRLAVRWDGDRVIRDLPEEMAAALPDAAVDLTDAIAAARTGVGIRSRDTAVNWMLPGECDVRVEDVDGRPEVVVAARATLDPRTAVAGQPLDQTSWDLTSRNEFLGAINQRGLRTTSASRTALRDDHVYVAYKNKKGMLSLDVDQRHRSLAGSAPLDPERGSTLPVGSSGLLRRRRRYRVELPFAGVSTSGPSLLLAEVRVGEAAPTRAEVLARSDGAWLQFEVDQPPGRYALAVRVGERENDPGLDLVVGPQDVQVVRRDMAPASR